MVASLLFQVPKRLLFLPKTQQYVSAFSSSEMTNGVPANHSTILPRGHPSNPGQPTRESLHTANLPLPHLGYAVAHTTSSKDRGDCMGIALTREQVLALAPDESSAKAANGLVADSKWVTLGADDEAVWGECQGSGSNPYQAQVDLGALVSRCSCPSRKFPCKHGLALLLNYAQKNPRFAATTRPAWVDEWLASRRNRSERKAAVAETSKPADDPAAASAAVAKRESTRWSRIEAGATELERWIADQFRRGLARFGQEQRRDGVAMAARMIDAQAPGLAARLREALALMSEGAARQADVIASFGLLQLINEGVRRRGQLSAPRLADLRAALGWAADKAEAQAAGDAVSDQWRVLGQIITEPEAKLSERRVWLQGLASRRHALLQEFSYAGKAWDREWQNGAQYAAELRFYPGSVPLRAIAQTVSKVLTAVSWTEEDAETAFDAASQAFASNPWLAQFPLVFAAATPFRDGNDWRLHTAAGTLPWRVDEDSAWTLLAFSGGHAVTTMGEWAGNQLRLLSGWDDSGARWALETGE